MKAMKNMKLEDVAISEKVGAGGGMTSKSQNHEKGVSKSLDNEGLGDMMKAGENNGGLEKPLDDAVSESVHCTIISLLPWNPSHMLVVCS